MVTYSQLYQTIIIGHEMDAQQITSELERLDGSFPGDVIQYALEHREEVTNLLLNILEQSTIVVDRLLSEENYFGHIYAMFLLAQFREKKAYPLVAEFFSLPGETTWELAGDIVTEDLGRILASVSCGDTTILKKMIENSALDEMVRAAAMDSLLVLLASEEIRREDLVDYFSELYRKRLEKEKSMIWNHLVVSSVNIHPKELLEEIEDAYRNNLVDDDFISFSQVEEALLSGNETVLGWLRQNKAYMLVTDAISDISKWLV